MKKIKEIFILICAGFVLSGCSSAPKRSMIVSNIYDSSISMLESANASILLGDYSKADLLLKDAYNSAMSIDNYDLLTSVLLARVSLDLSYNPPKVDLATESLEKAQVFAKYSDYSEKQTALCILAEVRIATTAASTGTQEQNYNSLLSKLEENKPAVKGDPYNEAHFDSAAGDIYKLQNKYTEAEEAFLAATKSFTDNLYLSEIGINWYKVAQVRSLNNNKQGALEAIESAIYYDRLAENSIALATDYFAKGSILQKGNPSASEKEAADFAFQHSKDIYASVGIE